MNSIQEAAEIIKDSKHTIALTGAGISVESGIPDFRSAGGLWDKYDPAIYASIESFNRMPEKVWDMLFDMAELTMGADPNPGHKALAELEEMGLLKAVITQNIDNLHQEAGSEQVIEYHGNASQLVCRSCGHRYSMSDFSLDSRIVPQCPCGSILKPDIVFFGEAIPQRPMIDAQVHAESADVVLVVGTSAIVYPAAGIPVIASRNGARIIEFNIEETGFTGQITDIFIQGPAGVTLQELLRHLA